MHRFIQATYVCITTIFTKITVDIITIIQIVYSVICRKQSQWCLQCSMWWTPHFGISEKSAISLILHVPLLAKDVDRWMMVTAYQKSWSWQLCVDYAFDAFTSQDESLYNILIWSGRRACACTLLWAGELTTCSQ